MKTRSILFTIISLFVLNSCVIKSLNPFYTKKSISFDDRFLGEWVDSKKGIWTVVSFKSEITKENPLEKMKKEDLQLYEAYKYSYYIKREYKGEEALFIVTPFKINNQTFLDFYPLEYQENIDNLLESHIVYSHSLVKYDILKDGKIDIRWLDEEKIETLFKQNKIKLEHKKIGALKDKFLLTASSSDLEKFIEKYMNSKDLDKWDTSTKFTLTKKSDTN